MKGAVLMLLPLLMVLSVPRVTCAQQWEPCVSTVPANIQAGLLTQDIVGLLQSSQTFRAQCARIAAALHVRVDLDLVQTLGGARGETTITRYEAGALRANVRIAFGQDYRELISHEFEHVIEQLEGVDLQSEADHGRAWMIDRGVFETRRASEAGRRVRRECQLSEAQAAVAHHALRHGLLRELGEHAGGTFSRMEGIRRIYGSAAEAIETYGSHVPRRRDAIDDRVECGVQCRSIATQRADVRDSASGLIDQQHQVPRID